MQSHTTYMAQRCPDVIVGVLVVPAPFGAGAARLTRMRGGGSSMIL